MTEFWQSQAKKFCDFCKCWITDNKPSVEFHERGKKHKENVARKIKEVHKKGVKTVKDNDELKRNLQEIENAALKAYKKDVGEEAFNKATQRTTPLERPVSSHQRTYPEGPTATHGEPSSAGCSIVYNDGHPVVRCSHGWTIAQSPEGYYYYYNSETLATQWKVPECLQTEDNDTEVQEVQPHDTPVSNSEQQKEDKEDKVHEVEHHEQHETQDKSPTVKSFSPYGAWTTVQAIEPSPSNESKTKDKNKKLDEKEESEATEDPEITAKRTENKFKERELPKIAFHKTDDQVIAFKKRKLNNERKRNIRQTKLN